MLQNKRFIAIGDIHGQSHLLEIILKRLRDHYMNDPDTMVIFMGDYLNRSPGPEACRSTLQQLRDFSIQYPQQSRFLRGNHEWNFLQTIEFDLDHLNISNLWEVEIYKEFYDFLKNTIPFFETEEYFFAHAGGVLESGKLARSEESEEESYALYWRYDVQDVPHEKTVIRAHRIVTPEEVFGDHLISTDLGSYRTGRIGAVVLPEQQLILSDRESIFNRSKAESSV